MRDPEDRSLKRKKTESESGSAKGRPRSRDSRPDRSRDGSPRSRRDRDYVRPPPEDGRYGGRRRRSPSPLPPAYALNPVSWKCLN